jgi:DNA-directed RNA polymerase subunit H (RpoH/RPB5)
MEQVKKEYSNMDQTFKRMYLHVDPVARYYNLKLGDMIKIVNASEGGGEVVWYRIIVEAPARK